MVSAFEDPSLIAALSITTCVNFEISFGSFISYDGVKLLKYASCEGRCSSQSSRAHFFVSTNNAPGNSARNAMQKPHTRK